MTRLCGSGESFKLKSLIIIRDNQAPTCLITIITINDTSIGDLPLIITSSVNKPKRFDSDNTINLSTLIVSLVLVSIGG